MIAYYHGTPPLPYLYTVSFWPGIATRQYNYATLGCGSTVAEFILSRSNVSKMSKSHAILAAIYTVEEVKKVDAFCGGPTKLATLDPDTKKGLVSDTPRVLDLIKCTADSMEKHEDQMRASWKAMMETIAIEALKNYHIKYPEKNEDKTNE